MSTSSVFAPVSIFTAADRCDRCGARASLLALLHRGGELLFCGHHARMHRSALKQVADFFEDQPAATQPWAA